MDFATKVRVLRALKNWSQKELAEKIKVSWTTISRWESGKILPQYTAAQKIDALLQVAQRETEAKEKKEQ